MEGFSAKHCSQVHKTNCMYEDKEMVNRQLAGSIGERSGCLHIT